MNFLTDLFHSLGIDPALGGLAVGLLFGWIARSLRVSAGVSAPPPRPAPPTTSFSIGSETLVGSTSKVTLRIGGTERVLEGDTATRLLDALREGQKIAAIQILREATGLGLKESKDLVEAIESARG